ncbi:DEAD/DEAH box helicase [Deinococcus radiophilus]|uniref:DEAD/DEAH box helicase n=2 Tax=Deinococcus radiophilus TaxID=32062 RepID=A0A3S0IDQ6_9DEIO|nr:DEAD/DEAH box helicase [Deinococcus radiophilus]RTR30299.1 DEAD/DEAH box helicase [Deinococcus radiophilus]UFA49905.1 DEAD/DEAH box helicase [Deinococcus radiophilus]
MTADPRFARLEGFVRDTLGGGASLLYEEEAAPADIVPVSELGWSEAVRRGFGFGAAYRHQAATYRLLEQGQHVIVTTPTASGKTGAFFPALFGALERDPQATALLVYPLVALGQDQREKLQEFARRGDFGWPIGEFQGSAQPAQAFAPGVRMVTATPDKLHWNLTHGRVREFLRHLKYLVLDEAHTYRGGFGSEVSGMLRRLLALSRALGASPQVVLSTATIGNPAQFARELVGVDAVEVAQSGAARHGKRYYLADHRGQPRRFWDAVVRSAAERELKVLAFFRGRSRAARLYGAYRRQERYNDFVHLYMSGTSERAGRLTGFRSARSGVMFATNALEAGVDIGDLEVVILDGYPGSRMAFRQMAGRSGRVGPGAVLYLPTLSAGGVPLPVDAFYSNAGNFRELLTGPIEKAVVEAENPYLAPRHQDRMQAEFRAAGLPLPPDDPRPAPAHWLLRGEDMAAFHVIEQSQWDKLGTGALNFPLESPSQHYALTEKHEEAVFSLDGQDYKVTHWEKTPRGTAILVQPYAAGGQMTRGLYEVRVQPLDMGEWTRQGPVAYRAGTVQVTRVYRGYQIIRSLFERVCLGCDRIPEPTERVCRRCGGTIQDRMQDQKISEHLYDQPVTLEPLRTVALEVAIDAAATEQPTAAAHTLKHLLQKLIPEAVACEAGDLAGAFRSGFDTSFYIYDDWRGGLGIARRALDSLPALLQRSLELTEKDCCTSPEGCFECIAVSRCYAPLLPSGERRPVNKFAARALLAQVPGLTAIPAQELTQPHLADAAPARPFSIPPPADVPQPPADWPSQARELLDLRGLSLPEVSARLGIPSREIGRAVATSTSPLRLAHPKWGEGHLLQGFGQGERREVLVYFPGVGQKRLLLKYAGLKVVSP